MDNPVLVQNKFVGRCDNGTEVTAEWKDADGSCITMIGDAENDAWDPQAVDVVFRCRFLFQETDGTNHVINNVQLQYNNTTQVTGWVNVTATSSHVQSLATDNVVDAIDTTDSGLGSGTFETNNNGFDEANGVAGSGGNDSLNVSETDIEYSCQVIGSDVADNDVIQLRITDNGTALDSYTTTAQLTVDKPAPSGRIASMAGAGGMAGESGMAGIGGGMAG